MQTGEKEKQTWIEIRVINASAAASLLNVCNFQCYFNYVYVFDFTYVLYDTWMYVRTHSLQKLSYFMCFWNWWKFVERKHNGKLFYRRVFSKERFCQVLSQEFTVPLQKFMVGKPKEHGHQAKILREFYRISYKERKICKLHIAHLKLS